MTHTPGPWNAPSMSVFAATGECVAEIQALRRPKLKTSRNAEMLANARLVAAAPALLAALKSAHYQLEMCAQSDNSLFEPDTAETLAECEAVIALAEG